MQERSGINRLIQDLYIDPFTPRGSVPP